MTISPDYWVALAIGNSRSHWAYIEHTERVQTWAVSHASNPEYPDPTNWSEWQSRSPAFQYHQQAGRSPFPPLWVVSVVPVQTQIWQTYPRFGQIRLADIPLGATYPTLGVDRALALWTAGTRYGWPVLVIDCGTALSITGADPKGQLVGGAILPGLGLQLRSLTEATAALPLTQPAGPLPPRWATDTPTAIQSGVFHTLVAGLQDFITAWQTTYPQSAIVLTGGDHATLAPGLEQRLHDTHPSASVARLYQAPHLLIEGVIQRVAQQTGYPR